MNPSWISGTAGFEAHLELPILCLGSATSLRTLPLAYEEFRNQDPGVLASSPFQKTEPNNFFGFFPLPMLHGMWDLSSPSKDGACAPCTGRAASTNGPRGRPSNQFSAVAQSCPTLCDPMDCSMPGLPVHHQSQSLLKLMSIEPVMPSNHLILCCLLLLLASIMPSIRVFSSGSVLHIRWPKY